MEMTEDLLAKGKSLANQLERTTKVVWIISIFAYVIMSSIAFYNQAWIAVAFFTCLMLGVRVVYLWIQASLIHFQIMRSR
jgi:membrane protein YdbS with pleckstrin-like domain